MHYSLVRLGHDGNVDEVKWPVVAERSSSPDSSFGVISKVWVQIPVMTLHSALPARLLVDDTHAFILTDCEGGNPVSAPAVGGNVPLVAVDLIQ